ncbi:MAG TPA: cytochrome ubiquinol oxidase subunit I [Nitrospira sp.]
MPFDLNLPAIQFPLVGNSLAVAIPSLLHIVLAGLSVGFLILAPIFEWYGQRTAHFTDLAYGLTKFTVLVFSISTVLAVIMVELLIGLFPVTTMWVWNQFREPIGVAIAAFLLQFACLYPYYHYWERIRARSSVLHMALGTAAALLMLIWVAVLDGMGSYMLTPVKGASPWDNLWNPTWLSLGLHRLVGELAMAGFVIAAYAAWRLGRPNAEHTREYYQYMFMIGWLSGLAALLLQPLTGVIYASSIQRAAPDAYEQIVRGEYRLLAYAQFALIGLLMVGSHLLSNGAIHPKRRSRWLDVAIPVTALFMVTSVGYTTLRRAFLYLLVVFLLWSVRSLFVREGRRWLLTASFKPSMRPIALTLGVLSLLVYMTMGTIRETARRPYTVRHVISLHDRVERPTADGTKQREAAYATLEGQE